MKMNEIERLQQLAGITTEGAYVLRAEADDMPSKSQVMKMCKDGKSKKEICDMFPKCDQDKLKKMIDDCMKEMKESVNEGDGEPGVDYRSDTGEGETKKAAIGHIDNEKGMIKKELYLIGKNAIDVHKMLDGLPDSDFPHWWQAKIVKAHEYIQGAKNYLDAELNEPKAEPVVSDEVTSVDDPSGVS